VITKGDTFSVNGTNAGHGTVALWIIGRGYFDLLTVHPDRGGNFSFIMKPANTAKLTGGQFAIILQDPGPDGTMEIEPGKDSYGNLTVMNRGKIIVRLGAREDITGNMQSIADTIADAASIPGVDDQFVADTFFVEEPTVYFDQLVPGTGALPRQTSGETIRITGTTNAGTENNLHADLYDRATDEQVTEKILPVTAGTDVNHWTCTFDSPGLQPGNYYLSVGWMKSNTSSLGTADFSVEKTAGPDEPPVQPLQVPAAIPQLPPGLDTLLIIGIIFVLGVILYTVLKP
jgi:hypothetical protein